jgi:hypothetical protein
VQPTINRCCICGAHGAYGFFPRGVVGFRLPGRFYCGGHVMALEVEITQRLAWIEAMAEADIREVAETIDAINGLADVDESSG